MTYSPSYIATSPYAATPLVGRFLGFFVKRTIPPNPTSDRFFLIASSRYMSRPDNLAYDLYGDANLWWVFGVRNALEDPVFDLVLGRYLIVPEPTYLKTLLGAA